MRALEIVRRVSKEVYCLWRTAILTVGMTMWRGPCWENPVKRGDSMCKSSTLRHL